MLYVLLIDDNVDDRTLVVRQLNQEFQAIHIEQIIDQASFDRALEAKQFDIAITDYHLIWSTGLEVLHRLKDCCPKCPVIMFTNTATQENAVEAMKAGLDDYIIKSPRHYIRLASAVRLALERAHDRQKADRLEIRLQSLLNQLSVGVFRATLDGQLLEANAAFLQLLGVESLVAAQAINLHDMFQAQTRSQMLEQLRAEGQILGQEAQLQRVDGIILWVSLNKRIISQANEYFVEGLIEDISNRKQLENALHEKALELAEANRLKDEFLSTIYHELRSPLNSILGWARLLRSDEVQSAGMVKHALSVIERNAVAQTRIVEDVLDVSNIIQGKLRLTIAPVQLATVIEAAAAVVHPAAVARSIQMHIDLDPTVEPVLGDRDRLQQVVWNLLSNAVKFTPIGGQITVSLTQQNHQVPMAQLTVRDTGIGISATFLPYVFDRFRQADGSTTRQYGGMGLGLAIVRHLVELHGGTVKADSLGLGQGATFTVQIPLSTQSIDRLQHPPTAALTWEQMTEGKVLNGVKVLVVDDETDHWQLLEFMLSLCGATVFAVPAVAAAIEVIHGMQPDILISDIGMPQQDGYFLIQQVQSVQSLQTQVDTPIPSIALTAYSSALVEQQAIESGFQRLLPKPVVPEVLVQAMLDLIKPEQG